jgi:hypothetical protein
MTSHRLIHCQPDQLVHQLSRRPSAHLQPPHQVVPIWLPQGARAGRTVVGWRERWPGSRSMVTCCLEMERAATGVVAHLSTMISDRHQTLPKPITTAILTAWTARLLDHLAADVEAEQRSIDEQRMQLRREELRFQARLPLLRCAVARTAIFGASPRFTPLTQPSTRKD